MLAATDPNLFRLDWDRTCEALGAIVVLPVGENFKERQVVLR